MHATLGTYHVSKKMTWKGRYSVSASNFCFSNGSESVGFLVSLQFGGEYTRPSILQGSLFLSQRTLHRWTGQHAFMPTAPVGTVLVQGLCEFLILANILDR